MIKYAFVVAVLAAGCGGHKHQDTAEGGGATIDTTQSGDTTDHSGTMIPPEKMDEVQNDLKRKMAIVSRCLSAAMDNKDVPKGTHGKMTLEMVITAEGHASNVKVVKSDIESPVVQGCVKKHVEEIEFPTLPKSYETSYTYSMEAN